MSLPPTGPTRAGALLQRLRGGQNLTQAKFDRDKAEHSYRGRLLIGLFGLLLLELVVVGLAWLEYGIAIDEVKDMAAIILTPTFTLFGTVVGFYFSRGK